MGTEAICGGKARAEGGSMPLIQMSDEIHMMPMTLKHDDISKFQLNANDSNLIPLFVNKNEKATEISEEIDINREEYLLMEKDGRNIMRPKSEHARESAIMI